VTDKISGTPCIVEQMEKRKLGENFSARVPDNPNALVEPKILGTETLGTRGTTEPPQTNLRERHGYTRISLEIDLSLIIKPIQRFRKRLIKIYELLAQRCTG